jgi:flagellar hook protein FlgE
MSFQQGLSGLNAAVKNLDVIGNNVANASVVGFKGSQAQFSDVFASALGASGASEIGIGAQVETVAQRFFQGNITVTNNPLDLAINGTGFFRMSDNGTITYSRNGQFHSDHNGYIVDSDNRRLTGYSVDATGKVLATAPVDLQVSTADIAPSATTTFTTGLNLDAREAVLAPAGFDVTDPTTYTSSTSGRIYDSLGNSHVFTLYFLKTAPNAWEAYATVDGAAAAGGAPIGVTVGGGAFHAMSFSGTGALVSAAAPVSISVDLDAIAAAQGSVNSAMSPLDFSLDLSSVTQFGIGFSVNSLSQDGYTSGRLSGFSVAGDGVIQGHYSNGQNKALGQVVLASFNNPQGLTPLGRNQWQETTESGLPIVGAPLSGSLGALQAGAVEESNVDLTAELVNMITAQRVYQANAQSIKTQDAVLQTLLNLR